MRNARDKMPGQQKFEFTLRPGSPLPLRGSRADMALSRSRN